MIPETVDIKSELLDAWKAVATKKQASVGMDGVTIEKFETALEHNLDKLTNELSTLEYKPLPAVRIYIPKPGGAGERAVNILCTKDKVVQTFLQRHLNDKIDPLLSDLCHSYRYGKSVKTALENVTYYRSLGYTWTLESDIKSFFDSINHQILIRKLKETGIAEWIVNLVIMSIRIEIFDGEELKANTKGLPQGLAISPVLSNLYLLEFDKSCEDEIFKLIRYADDFVILCKTKADAVMALEQIKLRLTPFELELHPDKTGILDPETNLEYLGCTLKRSSEPSRTDELLKDAKTVQALSSELSGRFRKHTLYIQEQGCAVRIRKGKIILMKAQEELFSIPAKWIKEVLIFGNCHLSVDCIRHFLSNGIPVFFLANSGRYFGELRSTSHYKIDGRIRQSQKLLDITFRTDMARAVVDGKIHNQTAYLGRFHRRLKISELEKYIDQLDMLRKKLNLTKNIDKIRGVEGQTSHIFFAGYSKLIRGDLLFKKRSRRPPIDPVNSLLSFGYTLLVNLCASSLIRAGLDPYIGFLHSTRAGMPAMACDLVEEFRTPVVDSLIAYLVNTSIYSENDFYIEEKNNACLMKQDARKRFFTHFENRLSTQFVHPETKRYVTYRQCMDYQARELYDFILGRRFEYKPFYWRR